jgi:aspartate/methionine/tyrosine aminotransferase
MWFKRMELEVWFDRYQYAIDYDIGESAVKTLSLKDIGIKLDDVPLRYGYHRGNPALRAEVAGQYPGLTEDHVVVTTGASEANFAVVSSLVKPGDHMVVEHPNYPSLYEVPRSLGCDVSLFTLTFEDRFKPDWDRLTGLLRPETRLISLTHPNNPTGAMISSKELERVVALVEERDMYLLFDETYRHMASEEQLLPPAACLSDRVISISSMSKCYGLPGIRCGWLATTNRAILDEVLAIREQVSISNNALSEEIARCVLERMDVYLARGRERIAANRSVVADWIRNQSAFEWCPPEAGVVGFPRIKSGVRVEPEALYRRLAEEYRTFVVPGRCFEMDERFFRIGFGADAQEIRTGLENLDRALEDLS